MSNGWIDISECAEGYYLFIVESLRGDKVSYPAKVDSRGRIYLLNTDDKFDIRYFCGKALKLADINNNGEVLVEAKSG